MGVSEFVDVREKTFPERERSRKGRGVEPGEFEGRVEGGGEVDDELCTMQEAPNAAIHVGEMGSGGVVPGYIWNKECSM